MKFCIQDQTVVLTGIQSGTVHYASKKQLSKLSALVHRGPCSLMMTGILFLHFIQTSNPQPMDEIASIELQDLMQQYTVFLKSLLVYHLKRHMTITFLLKMSIRW